MIPTMKVFYSDTYELPLPEGHRFPLEKYRLLREALLDQGLVSEEELIQSPLVSDADLLRAHDADYVHAVRTGQLDRREIRRIGFPWSEGLVNRVSASMGGAVATARAALEDGIAGQLAGGTHHAHYAHGSGFCVFNDFAIAALHVLAETAVERVAIIDLDVHQGDGNASMLGQRDDVYVFSMHGRFNFPYDKCDSHLDVELDDGTDDETYLRTLESVLPRVMEFDPQLVLYQCGVDALHSDRLGRLALSLDGLKRRDEMVLGECRRRGIAVSMGLGGGYAEPIWDSVEAYVNTYRVVRAIYGQEPGE